MNLLPSHRLLNCIAVALLWLAAALPAAAGGVSNDVSINDVSILVLNHVSPSALSVASMDGTITVTSERESIVVRAGQSVDLFLRNGRIEARFGQQRVEGGKIELRSASGSAIRLKNGSENRAYSGTFEISLVRGGMKVVNRVPLEDYVASVVGSEYGFQDLEGSKAMAVVARTYALHAISTGKELYDTERFQVYRGLSHASSIAVQAARETAGQVLTFNNELIEAVYSASNGGRTATNTSVWGSKPLPYLQSRKDPWDTKSPHASWEWSVDKKELLRVLSTSFGMSVKKINAGKPGADGRVENVELVGSGSSKSVSASAFRAAIASHFGAKTVKSTFFSLNERRDTITFSGQGFGHGVGLSQWGTHFMSNAGHSYAQILDFYYLNTNLERLPSSGSPDPSLIEMPVLSSGSSVTASADLAPLEDVSGGSVTPKEKSSSIFSEQKPAVQNIWDTPKRSETKPSAKAKPVARRAGW